ncbi:putative Transmembrane protein [Melia azedarach]|uniref:Transmembrane protein n=1 Tax=Melia azedarach TaxID=155640 RepID=A0ACC1WPP2_MELAZ|nr:putative Transmembrane protein [Melia azedarach]
MATIFLANALKTLFCMLGSVMIATLIYTISIDGLPFRKELLTPWMAATLVDFYINVVPLAAWVSYKESNWVGAILWVILLVCFGSITTCLFIFIQLLKLSPQESLRDPIYHVLLRHTSKDSMEHKRKHSVVTARIIFSILGVLMLGTLVYTLLTDGSPFRKELLTPWMTATLIDFYINVVSLSVWVAYKESSWVGAFFWIILLICFGSITTCVYIVLQLFRLSSQDPVYIVLFNSGNRAEKWYEGTSFENDVKLDG